MMTDPIADLLTRIRNANRIRAKKVTVPASRLKVNILEILREEGFIRSFSVEPGKPSSQLHIVLKYGPDGEQVIRSIERVSRPGCRVYHGVKKLPRPLNGLGIYVLSTPKGVLSDRRARAEGIGGELLCKVC